MRSSTSIAEPCAAERSPADVGTTCSARVAKRGGVAVQRLPQSGDQYVVGAGHVAADHHHGGVEQVDRRGDRLADMPAALPDEPARLGLAAVGQVDDITDVADRVALLLQRAHQCPAAGDRLQAAGVAAPAGKPGRRRTLLCPNSPAAPDRAALQHAAGDDARPEPVDSFSSSRSSTSRYSPCRSASAITLASLSTTTGAAVRSRKYGRQFDAVPAAHHRGVEAAAAGPVDGARHAQPDAEDGRRRGARTRPAAPRAA